MDIIHSFNVDDTIAAYRFVKGTTTDNTVSLDTGSTAPALGVTTDNVKATATAIPVKCYGIAKVEVGDSFAAGTFVTSDASGRAVLYTAASTSAYYNGIAISGGQVTGAMAYILVLPGKTQVD